MKKVGKIKLNQFSKDELDRRKMNALKGGCGCTGNGSCNCGNTSDWSYYDNYGSSNKAYHY
jgi:natural product precursor